MRLKKEKTKTINFLDQEGESNRILRLWDRGLPRDVIFCSNAPLIQACGIFVVRLTTPISANLAPSRTSRDILSAAAVGLSIWIRSWPDWFWNRGESENKSHARKFRRFGLTPPFSKRQAGKRGFSCPPSEDLFCCQFQKSISAGFLKYRPFAVIF